MTLTAGAVDANVAGEGRGHGFLLGIAQTVADFKGGGVYRVGGK